MLAPGNNVLTYSVTSGPITVDVAGNVIVDSDVTAGMTYTVQVSATDSGQVPGPLTSLTPVTITVIVTVSYDVLGCLVVKLHDHNLCQSSHTRFTFVVREQMNNFTCR